MAAKRRLNLASTKVHITISDGENTFEGEIDPNEYFMHVIAYAIEKGKDPIDVLAFLADEGAKWGNQKSIDWEMRVGK